MSTLTDAETLVRALNAVDGDYQKQIEIANAALRGRPHEVVGRLARGFAAEWLRPGDPDRATTGLVDTLSTAMLAFYSVARGAEQRAAAREATPSAHQADDQIAARLEQIHQKLLHAEALTVGDEVFLFDLVRP